LRPKGEIKRILLLTQTKKYKTCARICQQIVAGFRPKGEESPRPALSLLIPEARRRAGGKAVQDEKSSFVWKIKLKG
jgi:hypothetical protein